MDSYLFAFSIQSGSGFIEEQNFWISYQSSCNCDTLFLPTGQLTALFTTSCFETRWKTFNKIFCICLSACGIYLFLSGFDQVKHLKIHFKTSRPDPSYKYYQEQLVNPSLSKLYYLKIKTVFSLIAIRSRSSFEMNSSKA